MNKLKSILKGSLIVAIAFLAIIFIIGIACCMGLMYCVEYTFDEG